MNNQMDNTAQIKHHEAETPTSARTRSRNRGGSASAPKPRRQPECTRLVGAQVVTDDFMWLRDRNLPEPVREYLTAERAFYDAATAPLRQRQQQITDQATSNIAAEHSTPCWTVAGAQYLFRWAAGAEFEELVRRSADGVETVVLRIADLTTTGFVRIGDCVVSPDGRFVAYSIDEVGDEVYTLRIRKISTGEDLDATIAHTYYGLAWLPDSTGLIYVKHDGAYRPHQVWMHQLHDAVNLDVLLLEEREQRFHLSIRVSGDHRQLIVRAAARTVSEEWVINLSDPTSPPRSLRGRREGIDYTAEPYQEGENLSVLLITNEEGGDYRLLAGSADAPTATLREVLAPQPTRRLNTVERRGQCVLVNGREGGDQHIWLLDRDDLTLTARLSPDEPGGLIELTHYDPSQPDGLSIQTESRRQPAIHYTVDAQTGARQETSRTQSGAYRAEEYEQEVFTVLVTDGVEVPVTILRHRTTQLDGTAPCLLYGYGAWEHVIEPRFNPALASLLDAGIVFAHAHVRGGGELGHHWWRDGRMDHKQRSFTDFLDVADQLAAGMIDGRRLVARGLSAGGLLMGGAYSQAPDRWAAVVAESPFVDPVTTMSDPSAPLVIVEREEWGDPEQPDQLTWMLSWSPYDNPPPAAQRPGLLVTSAIHDPRVSVWEPARWVGSLRSSGSTDADVLFRCEMGAGGHWPPPGRHRRIRYEAEILAWITDRMLL